MLSQNSTFRFPKRSQESVTVPLACCCNTPFSEWSRGWASSALPLRPAWYSSPHLRRQIGPPHGRWKFYWIHFWKFLCQRMRLRSFWNVLTPLWSWRGLKHLATDPSWQVSMPHLHVLLGGSFQATLAHGHRSAALRWQHANFQLLVILWHVDRERVTQLRCWQVYLQNLATSHGREEKCAVESNSGHSWAIHKNIELQARLKKLVRGSS